MIVAVVIPRLVPSIHDGRVKVCIDIIDGSRVRVLGLEIKGVRVLGC